MKNADRAKVVVEENARKLRKESEATGVHFVAKYFELNGDRWVHKKTALNVAGLEPAASIMLSTTNGNATADDTEVSTMANKTEMSDSEDRSSFL